MEVGTIIEQVRWCIDEEKVNISLLAGIDENDDTYMDNIIKAKIMDALRWCLLYAPSELLADTGTAESDESFISSVANANNTDGPQTIITLPKGFIRLVRVRLPGWHKAVRVPIEEDSDEYLMLSDNTACATIDRPVAALIRTNPMKLELWPGCTQEQLRNLEISYVNYPNFSLPESESDTISVPEKLKSAFIYYIAYLVMSAYNDTKAANMLNIAKMNLGIS